ncbi:MAG: hypothetical protein EZS28_019094 [Streblomastix strix]|uniref:Uncharacterized protein n=1 Tax=Streblomastix strix TaxID=222440 RepID=A0A5J4VSJ2_9EUKA|nr:MAG: hypothetical protein EZS28_019094 [Streblomastix strix]
MAQGGTILVGGEDVDLNQVARIPQILKNERITLKKVIGAKQKQYFVDQIRAADQSITQKEGAAGVIGLTNKAKNRLVYDPLFSEDLRSEFFENDVMLNNEGKVVTEKFIENYQRYDQNPNVRFAEPSMQLGSLTLQISPEQINNIIMYSGSQKQKENENQRRNDEYNIQTQDEYGKCSMIEDQPPTILLTQEKLIEKQQQAIEEAPVSQENLAQIYDAGSLDLG